MGFLENETTRLFVVLVLTVLHALGSQLITSSKFHRVTRLDSFVFTKDEYFTPVVSSVACAGVCTKTHGCTSFSWHSQSKSCTIGHVDNNSPTGVIRTSDQHLLLFTRRLHCAWSLGNEVRFAGPTPMCVYFNNEKMNKSDAVNFCATHNGTLFRADNQDKVDLVDTIGREKNLHESSEQLYEKLILVDGNDEATEGEFTWSDGRLFTENEMKLFWNKDPNGSILENLVAVYVGHKGLVDTTKDSKYYFMCEMDVSG